MTLLQHIPIPLRFEYKYSNVMCEFIHLPTSADLPNFARTRNFYLKCDYLEVARVPEFYAAGEGKAVFWKKLAG